MDTKKAPAKDRTTANAAWSVMNYLIGGIVVYGGVGLLLSVWFGHRSAFLAGGILFGLFASMYLVFFRLRLLDAPSDGTAKTMERGA